MRKTFQSNPRAIPTYWNAVALILVLSVICSLGYGAIKMAGRFEIGQSITLSLSPSMLPYYALRSIIRILLALLCSLLFTFIVGTLAAKNRQAEKVIIPCIDILQSVPPLGFLAITIHSFIVLFSGSLLGPECAAIFVIFTAQVWNMVLSFYQSLCSVPQELTEAGAMFHLSKWQQFWRIEVPFAMPSLLWNAMMSMSSSWVFLVASEAITTANHTITLPGVGSYIAMAIEHKSIPEIIYAIVTMFVVIASYDQLLFRPLLVWAEKFIYKPTQDQPERRSWVLSLLLRSSFFSSLARYLDALSHAFIHLPIFRYRMPKPKRPKQRQHAAQRRRYGIYLYNFLLSSLIVFALGSLIHFISKHVTLAQTQHVCWLGVLTTLRVFCITIISALIWIPLGVVIGRHPRASSIVQPIAQFLAAFPANVFFPVFVLFILHFNLNINIWCSPLMILGTQWYILFNVVAGAQALPQHHLDAAATLQITGWLRWRSVILPGIFPYFITGAMTAAGGAWNISIIAEALTWGKTKLYAKGLGAYITTASNHNIIAHVVLGISVMSLFVIIINYILWRPLYRLAMTRYAIH